MKRWGDAKNTFSKEEVTPISTGQPTAWISGFATNFPTLIFYDPTQIFCESMILTRNSGQIYRKPLGKFGASSGLVSGRFGLVCGQQSGRA